MFVENIILHLNQYLLKASSSKHEFNSLLCCQLQYFRLIFTHFYSLQIQFQFIIQRGYNIDTSLFIDKMKPNNIQTKLVFSYTVYITLCIIKLNMKY